MAEKIPGENLRDGVGPEGLEDGENLAVQVGLVGRVNFYVKDVSQIFSCQLSLVVNDV